MKPLACLFACMMIAALATGANAQPASRASGAYGGDLTDVSAAKRKRAVRRAYGAPLYAPPVYGPPAYSMWRGADPSYGPGTAQMRAYQRQGVCVIDEGYGRYTFCSNK
jgi:hypothetical protein